MNLLNIFSQLGSPFADFSHIDLFTNLNQLNSLPLFSQFDSPTLFNHLDPFALFSRPSSFTFFSYIDPSVMTYAIQAGTGIIIALGAFIGFRLRKIKKKLGLNENKKKEIESDEIVVKKGGKDAK